jgi:hypothetical protein
MGKKPSWRDRASAKRDVAAIASAIDLDAYPCLGEILNGYHDDQGKVVDGGSILTFVGNDGKLTAIVSPKGMDNQFWCSVEDGEYFFRSIEKALQDNKGTWKPKKKGQK